jgi:hypothetical protein
MFVATLLERVTRMVAVPVGLEVEEQLGLHSVRNPEAVPISVPGSSAQESFYANWLGVTGNFGGGRSPSRTRLPPSNCLLTGKLTGNFVKSACLVRF